MHKELEKALNAQKESISIKKAIKSINKMYEVVIEDKTFKQRILLRNNHMQQKIMDIVDTNF